jgi:threonine dehydratase/serine racemase
MSTRPTIEDVEVAHRRISPHVHKTPVLTSRFFDEESRATVFFKCENLQKVGAFKARGALNAVLSLTDEEADRGVVTHSSGNHGQAVAYACGIRGISAIVVMPEHAPSIKVDAVRGYGADVVTVPHGQREMAVESLVTDRELTEIHPFDDPDVIAGQGTAALELTSQVAGLDLIVTPIGGGGLLSGSTIVAESRGLATVGVEPESVDDAFRSLRDGIRHPATGSISLGDGLLTGIGEIPFAILTEAGTDILLVSDGEMRSAMRQFALRMKLIVEPSGATVLAALLRYHELFAGKKVGAIISGGNVDLSLLSS